jgi:hypothetical protein
MEVAWLIGYPLLIRFTTIDLVIGMRALCSVYSCLIQIRFFYAGSVVNNQCVLKYGIELNCQNKTSQFNFMATWSNPIRREGSNANWRIAKAWIGDSSVQRYSIDQIRSTSSLGKLAVYRAICTSWHELQFDNQFLLRTSPWPSQ